MAKAGSTSANKQRWFRTLPEPNRRGWWQRRALESIHDEVDTPIDPLRPYVGEMPVSAGPLVACLRRKGRSASALSPSRASPKKKGGQADTYRVALGAILKHL